MINKWRNNIRSIFGNDYGNKVIEVVNAFEMTYGNDPDSQIIKNSYDSEWTTINGEYARYFVNDGVKEKALNAAIDKANELGLFDSISDSNWKEEYNYPYREITEQVLVEKTTYEAALVPVYDVDANRLNVGGTMNIYSGIQNGGKTLARATADNGKAYTLFTAGSMEVDARSTDSFSAMLEGMHATVGGAATIIAESDTNAEASGTKSGGISGFSGGKMDVKAGVGRGDDNQTVNVVIGTGAELTAAEITLKTNNRGSAKAGMKQDTTISAAGIASSSQPTESFYSTGIAVGPSAKLTATKGDLRITSTDIPVAESIVRSSNIGIAMNFDTMKGQNFMKQENNIDIGDDAMLNSAQRLLLEARQASQAHAETEASGGSLLDGTTAQAENKLDRTVRISIGDNAAMTAKDGRLDVYAYSGIGDRIYTRAYTDAEGGLAVANAKALADVKNNSEILVGQGAKLKSSEAIVFYSLFSSTSGYDNILRSQIPGIETIAIADSESAIGVPKTTAKSLINARNYIDINRGGKKKTQLDGSDEVFITAGTNFTTVKSQARSNGKGGIGVASSTAWIDFNLNNAVWIDNADLIASLEKKIFANNGEGDQRTHLIADSYSGLSALAGKVAPSTLITGTTINQIRSNDISKVSFQPVCEDDEHTVTKPSTALWTELSATYKRWQKKILGITITLTKANVTKKYEWNDYARCDFCDEGVPVDVDPADPGDMNQRYQDAYERAIANINVIEAMARALSIDQTALMASRLTKGLLPLTYMNTLASRTAPITKARYGDEENEAAAKVFVTDAKSLLEKDVRLEQPQIAPYRMWENNATFHTVYLLPNAARLYVDAGNGLDYVTDILQGEVLKDGYTYEIEVITALNGYAYANPEIPIGRTGRLNFLTGVLTIPSYTDFELYLHEISAAWLIEQMESGYIRTLLGDQEEFNSSAENGSERLPEGTVVEGLIDGGTVEGIRLYWIGETPETVADPDQTLILLMVNEETDEVDAFRTSVNMLQENAPLIDVSMYLYRDSESDRREEEKYNAFWFDTVDTDAEEDLSLVKVLTNVVNGSLEVPRPIRIKLRAYSLAGIDLPVYSLTDHLFVMCDGTAGGYRLFDGAYNVTFDGDTFDSDYTRVEGITSGDPVVTIKKNQPVWPEWIDGDEAEDIGGKQYRLIDDEWVELTERSSPQADQAAADAA